MCCKAPGDWFKANKCFISARYGGFVVEANLRFFFFALKYQIFCEHHKSFLNLYYNISRVLSLSLFFRLIRDLIWNRFHAQSTFQALLRRYVARCLWDIQRYIRFYCGYLPSIIPSCASSWSSGYGKSFRHTIFLHPLALEQVNIFLFAIWIHCEFESKEESFFPPRPGCFMQNKKREEISFSMKDDILLKKFSFLLPFFSLACELFSPWYVMKRWQEEAWNITHSKNERQRNKFLVNIILSPRYSWKKNPR